MLNETLEFRRFDALSNHKDDIFDFTPIFADTVLSILPSSLVLVASLVRIGYLWDKKLRLRGSLFRYAKLLSLGLYACSQLSLIIVWTKVVPSPTWSAVLATSLSLTSAVAFCILSYLEHARSIRPSSILLVYLLFSIGFDVLRLRASWSVHSASVVTKLTIASVVFKVTCLMLEAVEKARYLPHDYHKHRPEEVSSILNRGVFFWLNRLMKAGARTVLVPDALYKLDPQLKSDTLAPSFITTWQVIRMKQPKHSVIKSLARTLKWQLLGAVFPRAVLLLLTVSQPVLIERLLSHLQHTTSDNSQGTGSGLVAAYSLTFFGISIFTGFYWHAQYRLLTMIRGSLVAALNWQVVRLDLQSVKDPKATVTLMSGDVDRTVSGLRNLHEFWANTIQIIVVTYLLSKQIGLASLVPIAVAAISTIAVTFTSKAAGPRQKQWMEIVQQRVSLTSSILSSMKEVKMKGLSTILTNLTQDLRKQELQSAARSRVLILITGVCAWAPDLLSPAATFIVFYFQARHSNTTFNSTKAFTSLSLIILLAQNLKRTLESVTPFVAAFACLQRIEQFMCAEERKDFRDNISMASTSSSDGDLDGSGSETFSNLGISSPRLTFDTAIKVTDGSFGWTVDKDVLKYVNVSFPTSKLSCIIGPVASGKSTLCKALLGECHASGGRIEVMPDVHGIAFCDQTPYLTNRSIQQNIVGFSTFDQAWYSTVVRSVLLQEDIAALPKQDQTVIGTDGANLSGGQRHKVALARALYSRKRIMILDDILSGLDVDSVERIIHQVLGPNGLAKRHKMTVILATHAINVLPLADMVVVLNAQGEVEAEGSFVDVCRQSKYVQDLDIDHERQSGDSSSTLQQREINPGATVNATAGPTVPSPVARHAGDFAVYRFYFEAAGVTAGLMLLLIGIGFSAAKNFPTIWLKVWSDEATRDHGPGEALYPTIYACVQILALLFLGGLFYQGLMVVVTKAGRRLHEILLEAVMQAPLSLFSKTDVGALTNRFSQDMSLIDVQLAFGILFLSGSAVMAAGQAVVIAISSPWTTTTFPFMLCVLYYVQKFYLRTSRQLRLIDIEAKSPLYTHFLESTKGIVTLRAFEWTKETIDIGQNMLDESQRPAYLLYMIQRWLIFVLDTLVACLATVVAAVAIDQNSSSGFAGSALSQLVTFSQALSFIIIDWTDIETSIGAVSRIKHFGENTISENEPLEDQEPPADWPAGGRIEFHNLCASYDESDEAPSVLKDMNITIRAGEKIGICGRSGSGKSSTILTLLRMLDITQGSITIDHIDLARIPRAIIRSRLNTLPQHPVFLYGSVRTNLDPEHLHPDVQLLEALQKVGLDSSMGGSELDLDALFKPETLSHGQRQLFALAGATLRKSKIVILDEVTSNVDRTTDAFMQKVIREEFAQSTIIAVAHRLNTIVDFDQVIVMSEGQIVEIGSPRDLLAKPSGHFKAMWETGYG